MNVGPSWQKKLVESEEACRLASTDPEMRAVGSQVPGDLAGPDACYAALSAVTDFPQSIEKLKALARNVTTEQAGTFERWLLIQAALAAIPKLKAYPLYGAVKDLWAEEAMFWSTPRSREDFSLDSVRFREMARIATLRRFPAGQFHWERSGFPRSSLLHTNWKQLPRLILCVLGETRGFSPMVETHINARRKNRLTLSESEAARSYFLVAKSIEQQPEIKGLFTESWLYCATTVAVSPRLAWMREFLEKRGALFGSTGLAPTSSGFMTGSEERRKLYEQGVYQPRMTYVLWPRRAMLRWAQEYEATSGNGPSS